MQTDKTLPELALDLTSQVGDLVHNEIRLAKAEALEGVGQMGGGLVRTAIGIAFAGAAATLALSALAYVLGEMMPMWAGALIGAIVGGALAYVLIKSGLDAVKTPSMKRTANQVKSDLRLLKEHAPL